MLIYKDPCEVIVEGKRITLDNTVYTIIEDNEINDYKTQILKLANYEEIPVSTFSREIVRTTDFDECSDDIIELLESIISTDGSASYWYAHYVLHDRFELGEEAIKGTPYLYTYIVTYCSDSPELMLRLSEGTGYYKKFKQRNMLMKHKFNCD